MVLLKTQGKQTDKVSKFQSALRASRTMILKTILLLLMKR